MPKMMSPAQHMKEHARLAKAVARLEKRSIVARPKKLKMRDGAPLMHMGY